METIVLVSPNSLGSYRSAVINDENLALGYLAAVLEERGYHVEIIDARMSNLSPENVANSIHTTKPFFLGISVISEASVSWIKSLGNSLNRLTYLAHVSFGGYYPSLQPQAVLNEFSFADTVVSGEGEQVIVELVDCVAANESWTDLKNLAFRQGADTVVINQRRAPIANLDDLPFPKRYADSTSSEIVIEGSRGCFGTCNFCAVGPHFGADKRLAWRGHSPEYIVSEIEHLRKFYPDNSKYRFIDPDFFGSASRIHTERLLELAALIQKKVPGIELYVESRVTDIVERTVLEALKAAGLKEVYLGIESGSEKILTHMGKHAKVHDIINATRLLDELDINYQYGYMMVTPWTEYEDVIDNLNLLRIIGRVQFDKLFNELYIIPGTRLVEQVSRECQLIKESGSGYYLYETSQLIKNIRALSLAFEFEYMDFSKLLWHLYKDVQKHEQCQVEGAAEIQKILSGLFIRIFEFCLEKCGSSELTEIEVRQIAESAISVHESEIFAVRGMLNPSVTFC